MSGQLFLVSLLVAAAGAYLLRLAWQTTSRRTGCGGGCGCTRTNESEPGTTFVAVEQLTVRTSRTPGGSNRANTLPQGKRDV